MTPMRLLDPIQWGPRPARNRVVFGPHETNLARGRALSDRHVAYYERRAAGGVGVVVVEEASVHPGDWPYERAPLAAEAVPGWTAIARAVRAQGALAIAALGHAGGQGSSAYSQAPLWAPSRVPEVNSREVPKWMERGDIDEVVAGFATAARAAVRAGCDGVEVNAGQYSLIRQFLSGLTNHRDDDYAERSRLAVEVLTAVRDAVGPDAVVGLRLSCDELAPWAGLTPEMAVEIAERLAPLVHHLTVVRGSIYSVGATRPDGHTPPGFNVELARAVRAALPAEVVVVVQGSIVDPAMADDAVASGAADAVEMTRALLADAELVAKVAAGEAERVRPCLLCNQTCQVRDARNPIVTCVSDPRTGHELDDADADHPAPAPRPRDVLVVGAGPAGLEAARVAALRGHRVRVAERLDRSGGAVPLAAHGAGRARLGAIGDWLAAECARLGVKIETGHEVTAPEVAAHDGPVVLATGARPGERAYEVDDESRMRTAAQVLDPVGPDAADAPPSPVLVWDPIGGPIGVSVAETLRARGAEVAIATPDLIVGNELSRSGDLAPANARLQSAGVTIERRCLLRHVGADGAVLEDRFTGERRTVPAATVVDAGHRLPEDALWRAVSPPEGPSAGTVPAAGDAVAPRTILEAILEGRRVGLGVG